MMVSTLLCPETQMGASNTRKATGRALESFIHPLRRISTWIFIPVIACSNSQARWRLKHCSSNRTGSSPPSVVLEHGGIRRLCRDQNRRTSHSQRRDRSDPILRVRFGFGLKLTCTDSTSILSALRGIVHAECDKEQKNPYPKRESHGTTPRGVFDAGVFCARLCNSHQFSHR